jgi:16S rRNA (uracil1498-N3)-methyltransferase
MAERYYSGGPITGTPFRLIGDEARHMTRVMRKGVGDRVLLFDGHGREYAAMIEAAGRQEVLLAVEEGREVDREPKTEITALVAPPKGDRQKWLVEKLTELGCRRLVPLITERSVAKPSEKVIARWKRQVVEATKQCGRTRLMEIGPAMHFSEAMKMARRPEEWRGIAHPQVESGRLLADHFSTKPAPAEVSFAVGPEGGFTDEELAVAAVAGWHLFQLGNTILRIETAAMTATASVLSISSVKAP